MSTDFFSWRAHRRKLTLYRVSLYGTFLRSLIHVRRAALVFCVSDCSRFLLHRRHQARRTQHNLSRGLSPHIAFLVSECAPPFSDSLSFSFFVSRLQRCDTRCHWRRRRFPPQLFLFHASSVSCDHATARNLLSSSSPSPALSEGHRANFSAGSPPLPHHLL